MAPPSVMLATTAAAGVGRGHLSRAISLAEELVDLGMPTTLSVESGTLSPPERARIDGLRIETDLEGTSRAGPTVVTVVDRPDPNLPSRARDPDRLVVFDDTDVFEGRAAIVVQPSLPRWSGPGMAGEILAGYAYVPVGRAYRRLRASLDGPGRDFRGRLPRIVVCFGGSDPDDVLGRLAPDLLAAPDWKTDLVVGPDYAGSTDHWAPPAIRDPADLPERLLDADVVLIGAGTMKFEVAHLGRPAILLAVADDQAVQVGTAFAATGAASYLGDGRLVDPRVVVGAIRALLADAPARARMNAVGPSVVDGDGSRRTATRIAELARSIAR